MNGADSSVFIDTNIFVYAATNQSPFHQAALQAIQRLYDSSVEVWISRQILREYLAILSRPQPFTNPLPVATLIEDVRLFQTRFRIAEDDPQVMERLLTLMGQIPMVGRQVHDANIVATMLVYGISQLLTNNVDDFNRFSEFITVLPLVQPMI
ncbi:MAG TPA: VapC toxin family PIN domain ribonuclease [Cyanobacteria bacterium UBA11369]|nr:VapC toxin family PIN domain ribonuclease [Cyanobacteria bacterium UBA11371]HBE33605.1 VapC toxin family PIN domain ribonuclease [Cyanobacteria bacterium UBA11368]HBE49522.1 VapC toxin family PIN domain ribonuclease [Cyanobacteria bacterium UBA11369]